MPIGCNCTCNLSLQTHSNPSSLTHTRYQMHHRSMVQGISVNQFELRSILSGSGSQLCSASTGNQTQSACIGGICLNPWTILYTCCLQQLTYSLVIHTRQSNVLTLCLCHVYDDNDKTDNGVPSLALIHPPHCILNNIIHTFVNML